MTATVFDPLPHVFGYPGSTTFFAIEAPWRAWRDARLAGAMRRAWVSFARSGDPGDGWPRFEAGKPMLADFGEEEAVRPAEAEQR